MTKVALFNEVIVLSLLNNPALGTTVKLEVRENSCVDIKFSIADTEYIIRPNGNEYDILRRAEKKWLSPFKSFYSSKINFAGTIYAPTPKMVDVMVRSNITAVQVIQIVDYLADNILHLTLEGL